MSRVVLMHSVVYACCYFICFVLYLMTSNIELNLMTSKIELNLLSSISHSSHTHTHTHTPPHLSSHTYISIIDQSQWLYPITYFLTPSPDLLIMLIQVMTVFWLSITTKEEPRPYKSASSTLPQFWRNNLVWEIYWACNCHHHLFLTWPFQSFKQLRHLTFTWFNPFHFHTHRPIYLCFIIDKFLVYFPFV